MEPLGNFQKIIIKRVESWSDSLIKIKITFFNQRTHVKFNIHINCCIITSLIWSKSLIIKRKSMVKDDLDNNNS
jgi:hypothetical protein